MRTLIIFLFISIFSFGQNSEVEDLLASLRIQKNDTNKVHTLNELAWQYRSDLEMGLKYGEQAKELSLKLSFDCGYRNSLARLAGVFFYNKKYTKAEPIYLELLQLEKKADDQYGMARAENQLGEIYGHQKEYLKGLEFSLRSHERFIDLGKEAEIAITASNISKSYRKQAKYDKALSYLHKSFEIRKKRNDVIGLAKCHARFGNIYFAMKNYDDALIQLFKSEEIYLKNSELYGRQLLNVYHDIGSVYSELNQLDKAMDFYEKSLELRRKLDIDKDPLVYSNIGSIYFKQGRMDQALSYYLKGAAIVENSDGEITSILVYENLGNVYYEKGDLGKAIFFYKKALVMAEESKEVVIELNVLDGLSNCYDKRKNYKMMAFYDDKYIELSKVYQENYRKAVRLDSKFNREQFEEIILRKDEKLTKAKLREANVTNMLQNRTIYAMIIGVLLLLILAFAFYRNRQHKQKALLAEKNANIERQKLEKSLKDMELKSLNAMLEGQEEERQRIAADLHDRLGSMLSMVKLHFQSMDEHIAQLSTINKNQYEKANDLLDNACVEVRKIAHNMITGVLDKFGLVEALEDLSDSLNQGSKMKVEFISFGMDERLNAEMEISIYRIIQELVTNTIKHGQPTELTIQLLKSKSNLNLTVEDNGAGFNAEDIDSQGLGLKNITSRVDHMNGKFIIDSSEGNGTTVTIDIPHLTKNDNA